MVSKTTFLENKFHIGTATFHKLKQWIYKTLLKTALAYFDCKKPVVIQTDASGYGLIAALLEDGRPIAFAFKSLTDVET